VVMLVVVDWDSSLLPDSHVFFLSNEFSSVEFFNSPFNHSLISYNCCGDI
jgi:hypothetical protein